MIAQSKSRFIRMSPMKTRLVVDLLRGKDVNTCLALLAHVEKRSKEPLLKALKSAINNAKQKGLQEEQLFVSKISADQGPMWKRFRAAAFGRAVPVLKRSTHLTIELDLITK